VIRSMTGFATVSREDGAQKVHVTLKSVNHRFLDVAVKVPSVLAAIESRIRAGLQQRLVRGRVEVALSVEWTAAPSREVVLDDALLDRVAELLAAARARGVIAGALTASDVLRIPQVLDVRLKAAEPAAAGPGDQVAQLVDLVIAEATDALVRMRETEGQFLAADLDKRLAVLSTEVDELERLARAGQDKLEARLRERLASMPPDLAGDTAAVAQEIVRFVARSDVDEEVVRLRGHIGHWRELSAGSEACGRKLDFLVQEMNREINTIGSKVEGPGATEVVIAAKAELERVREQVQNVE
jgi:uncharacterized protein (TIGR00255 family)